jgi:radical SAM protein with 4Fe4S-binding SPASM domain|tara:strand:+ start:918 stop:2126 length:1209 start_codon:yes stop_codon:yes gene_type:complete
MSSVKDNKHFCMMPWVHMHLWPAGFTYPCCMSDPDYPIGNTQTQSLQDIWNGEQMRKIRLNMLSGEPSKECRRCYELEDNGMQTLRNSSITNFADKHWQKVMNTSDDGSAGDVNMAYMDIRFSNLCNLKCRSCGPQFSSSWFEDHKQMYGELNHPKILQVRDEMKSFMDELEPLLESVERVYWAGGEPLITQAHYDILDKWIAMGKRDVAMDYTTNFTQMRFKKKTAFEYWNAFDKVRVAASLDANHKRGEYLRKNMDWDIVVQNRRDMLEQCPQVYFELTPTVSVYNVLNLPDFHKEWIEQGLLEPANIRINILLDPTYMRLSILPVKKKDKIRLRYLEHLKYLDQFDNINHVKKDYESILNFINDDRSEEVKMFLYKTFKVDKLRQEDVFEVFPELEGIA